MRRTTTGFGDGYFSQSWRKKLYSVQPRSPAVIVAAKADLTHSASSKPR
jgi:hypothetical protein